MRLALCNEVLREREFAAQCAFAAAVGYDGLEVAPFTLADDPLTLPAARIADVRSAAADAGVAITGLHWLLVIARGSAFKFRAQELDLPVAGRLLGATYFLTSLLDHPDFTDEHLALMPFAGLGGSTVPVAVTESSRSPRWATAVRRLSVGSSWLNQIRHA